MGLKFKPDSSGLDPVIHGFVLVRFTGRKAVDTRIKSGQDGGGSGHQWRARHRVTRWISTFIPTASAYLSRVFRDGLWPLSRRATVGWLVPISLADYSWVNPALVRALINSRANANSDSSASYSSRYVESFRHFLLSLPNGMVIDATLSFSTRPFQSQPWVFFEASNYGDIEFNFQILFNGVSQDLPA